MRISQRCYSALKHSGGGVCRAANGTVLIKIPSLTGRVGVLYRYLCCAVDEVMAACIA